MKRKLYEPVREFERQTSYCPLYLAWRIVDEARDYFRADIPEAYARKLARRAEAVFAKHPFWQKEAMSARGYGHILVFMRHWLAGILHKENPVLYRQLPESFKIGRELPMARSSRRDDRMPRRCVPTKPRFVHGCELLTV